MSTMISITAKMYESGRFQAQISVSQLKKMNNNQDVLFVFFETYEKSKPLVIAPADILLRISKERSTGFLDFEQFVILWFEKGENGCFLLSTISFYEHDKKLRDEKLSDDVEITGNDQLMDQEKEGEKDQKETKNSDDMDYRLEFRSIMPSRRVRKKIWTDVPGLAPQKEDGTSVITDFVIMPYQRGYRWREENVRKLLDDILKYQRDTAASEAEFVKAITQSSPNENNYITRYDFYCLQSLSVMKLGENKYELIDGQQRLTTAYLIFNLFRLFYPTRRPEKCPFDIVYKRSNSLKLSTICGFLEDGEFGSAGDECFDLSGESRQKAILNIRDRIQKRIEDLQIYEGAPSVDIVYINKAICSILSFICDNFSEDDQFSKLKDFFDIFKRNVLFLWYETPKTTNPYETFVNLNSRQIRLTNAELVKSLVLRKEAGRFDGAVKEWERIEQGLNKEDLWGFICGKEIPTRIDFLLELFARRKSKEYDPKKSEYGHKVFPGLSTPLKGGVAITYRDSRKSFGAIRAYTKHSQVNAILHKVLNSYHFSSLIQIVYSRTSYRLTEEMHKDHPEARYKEDENGNNIGILSKSHDYDMSSNIMELLPFIFFEEKPEDGKEYIIILGRSDNKRVYKFIRKDYVSTAENFNYYKVYINQANGNGEFGEKLSEPIIEKAEGQIRRDDARAVCQRKHYQP